MMKLILFLNMIITISVYAIEELVHETSLSQKRNKYETNSFIHMEKHIPRETFIQRQSSNQNLKHEVVVAVRQNNLDKLKQIVRDRATPGHPQYQQWLTFQEVGTMVQNEEGFTKVKEWLDAYGVEMTWHSPYKEYVRASAPIATWEKMLSTKFFEFEDLTHAEAEGKKGQIFHRALEYSIPEELKESIFAVFHTVQTPPRFHAKYRHRFPQSAQTQTSSQDPIYKTNLRVDPAKSSKLTTLMTGSPVTISFLDQYYKVSSNLASPLLNQSVFETSNEYYNPSDLTKFQNTYGTTVQSAISIGGHSTTSCTGTKDCGEGNLDIMYIMGMAQQTASIFWWVSQASGDPFVSWIQDVASEANPPQSNSISWGEVETGMQTSVVTSWETEAAKLAGRGVTIMVSSGDDGAPNANSNDVCYCSGTSGSNGYNPSFPATSEWVVAVGATMGPETNSPEVVCSSSTGGVITSGGGFSTIVDQPSYQKDAITYYFQQAAASSSPPLAGYNAGGRGYPDISFIGVNYQIFIDGVPYVTYGTSCTAPVFAAFVTLVNSARLAENKTAIGFINPTLYATGYNYTLGIPNMYNATFNDVTTGNNFCCASGSTPECCTIKTGFTALKGWDPTTGWGSIDYTSFAAIFEVASPYTPNSNDDDNTSGLSTAAVAGIVIAVLVVVFVLICLGYYVCCRVPASPPPQAQPAAVAVVVANPTVISTTPVTVQSPMTAAVQMSTYTPPPTKPNRI